MDELKLYTQHIPSLNVEPLETHQEIIESTFNTEVEQTTNEPLVSAENVFTDQILMSRSVQLDRQFISTEQVNRNFDPDLLDIFLKKLMSCLKEWIQTLIFGLMIKKTLQLLII